MGAGILAGLAGVLGAGGSIAGGLLNKPATQNTYNPPSRDPYSDPLTAAASYDALLNLGFNDPTLFSGTGPLTRAIQGAQRVAIKPKDTLASNWLASAIQSGGVGALDAIRRNLAGEGAPITPPAGGLQQLIQARPGATSSIGPAPSQQYLARALSALESSAGMSIEDLIAAEAEFQKNVTQRTTDFQPLANQTMQGRIAAATARAEMLQGLTGNMQGVRDKELTRLNSQYDTAQQGLIRSANAGGYNPGRALGELEKSRVVDADLEAWNRAVKLISGQGNLLNLLSGQPIDQAAQLGQVRAGGSAGSSSSQTGASELGSGIAQAVPAGLLSYNIARQYQSGGPAAAQQVQVPNYVNGVQVG